MIAPLTLERAFALIENRLSPKCLSKIQRLIIQGAWNGLSYQEIAQAGDYDYGYVKDAGGKLWKMMSADCNQKVNKTNFRGILQYLAQQQIELNPPHTAPPEARYTPSLLGRVYELQTLKTWLAEDSCSIILVLGMGGVGKTSLARTIADQVVPEFDHIWWRSLRNAPPLSGLLQDLLQDLSFESDAIMPRDSDALIATFFDYLRLRKCLLIFDNAESILEGGAQMGEYCAGYENYGQLIQTMTESSQGCLIITSREPPQGIFKQRTLSRSVQTLSLEGLDFDSAHQLLQAEGAMTSASLSIQASEQLVTNYAGNPLALKIVAETIQSLYAGNITRFLADDTFAFGNIWELLHQQFDRLSDLEKSIMGWLCIYREWVSLDILSQALTPKVSSRELLEALATLKGRSLIETHVSGYSQQPVVMEFMTEWLMGQFYTDITHQQPNWLMTHAILALDAKDYLVDAQTVLLFEPLFQKLSQHFYLPKALEQHLLSLIKQIQRNFAAKPGYAAGNLLNLLRRLDYDFSGLDLSYLTLWQADLRNLSLPRVNLAYADLAKSQLPETFQSVFAVALNPTGTWLALAETTGRIQLWSLPDYQHHLTLEGHATCPIWSLAFHPSEPILASASSDRTIRLWEYQTGKCLQVLTGHTGMVMDISFTPPVASSPDPEIHLISTGEDGQTRVWNRCTEASQVLQEADGIGASCLNVDPPGHRCAISHSDGTVHIVDLTTKEQTHFLPGQPRNDVPLIFWKDRILSGDGEGMITLWPLSEGSKPLSLKGHFAPIIHLEIDETETFLASASADQTIRLWDLATQKCLKILQGHSSRITSLAMNHQIHLIVSSSEDGTVKFWDLPTGKLKKTIHGFNRRIWSVAFAPETDQVIGGYEDHAIRKWCTQTGEALSTDCDFPERIQSLCFSPNGQYQASATFNYEIIIQSLKTGNKITLSETRHYLCWAIAFSPNNQWIGSCGGDNATHLWNVQTGQKVKSFIGHHGYTMGLGFSADSQFLFTGSVDGQVKQWDVESGRCIRTFSADSGWVWALSVDPVQSYVAAGYANGQVLVWDFSVPTHQPFCLQGHQQMVLSLAFSPEGHILTSGSIDGVIRVWDLQSKTCQTMIKAHTEAVSSVAFSQRGNFLASGSHDELIKIWSTETWDCLQTLSPPTLFADMNIHGVKGLTSGQTKTLMGLGAIDYSPP